MVFICDCQVAVAGKSPPPETQQCKDVACQMHEWEPGSSVVGPPQEVIGMQWTECTAASASVAVCARVMMVPGAELIAAKAARGVAKSMTMLHCVKLRMVSSWIQWVARFRAEICPASIGCQHT